MLVKGSPIFTPRKHKHSCKEKHSPKQRRFLSLKLEQSFQKEISITMVLLQIHTNHKTI